MTRRQVVLMLAVGGFAAGNTVQLWSAGHTIAALAFGVLAPLQGLSEYKIAIENERPEPWRVTTESERVLSWVAILQVACMFLGWPR